MPRRHDLVWLDPAAAAGDWHAAPAERARLRAWIDRRLPLVAARRTQATPTDWLSLGFTVPGRGPRQRLAVAAAPAAVVHHRPPLTLAEALPHAPRAWRTGMATLLAACRAAGLEPRIYGSLATQVFSGTPCLHTDSDLDLLIDCGDASEALAALAVLTAHAGPGPRVDGELRLESGWAVAWRELAAARAGAGPVQVLAKSDTAVALLTAAELLVSHRVARMEPKAESGDGMDSTHGPGFRCAPSGLPALHVLHHARIPHDSDRHCLPRDPGAA